MNNFNKLSPSQPENHDEEILTGSRKLQAVHAKLKLFLGKPITEEESYLLSLYNKQYPNINKNKEQEINNFKLKIIDKIKNKNK